jgi:DNA-binding MarR family transcriptional regulator
MSTNAQPETDSPAPAGAAGRLAALDQLFAETVALFQSLRAVASKIHTRGDLAQEEWTILQGLGRDGARTVADIGNDCGITKSQAQKLVKALEKQGVVEQIDNPESKRAKLVELTDAGRALIQAMDNREVELLTKLPLSASEADLRAAATAIADVRAALGDDAWRKLLNNNGAGS